MLAPVPLGGPLSPTGLVEVVLREAVRTADLAPSTLVEFSDVMRRFARFAERGLRVTDIGELGEAEVRAFVESRRSDGDKPSSSLMHNRRTVCRYLFATAIRLGICAADPTVRLVVPPREPTPARPLTDTEVELCRSYAAFHRRDVRHPVAWALGETTARTIEIANVRVRDVDLPRGMVHLPGSARTQPRTVAFTDWGIEQIERRLRLAPSSGQDTLLPVRSRKVPRATAGMTVIEVLRAAGIKEPDVRPISVAAWRGARARAAGASIEEVAHLLGVRSLDRATVLIGSGWLGADPTDRG